ncbi:hypothetical protein BJD99_05690 [Rhodococcus sp. 1163]|nr:hypothetical protein BJD99_05690 [Rhodococcus sp. 1163]
MSSESEHRQGDECLWTDKSESDASEESDLGVHGFDESVGQAVFDSSKDLFAVAANATLQCDERFDTAAPCPLNPAFECVGGLVDGELRCRGRRRR